MGLKIERLNGSAEVYDITVKHTNNFFANNILVHNCQEITLPVVPLQKLDDPDGRIALCTLSAVNLGNIKSLDDLDSIMRNIVYGLDNVLDYQEYPLLAAAESVKDYRPLGIGVTNLAYYLAKQGLTYNDPKAWSLIHETMEAIQFYGIKASVELAKIKGPCRLYKNTKYADGLVPIDHYNKNVDDFVKPDYKMDWDWLRGELKEHGIRNATITALMPSETSSKISNATNGVEPVRGLVTVKGSKANISKHVVPEINRLKNKYDFLWEMKSMEGVIKCMATFQKFVDQSISTNLSYNPQNFENGEIPISLMIRDLLLCNKYGIKTLYYHNTNDNRGEDMQDMTAEASSEHSSVIDADVDIEADCDSCIL